MADKTNTSTPMLYWHVHHDLLAEACYDLEGRIDSIRTGKPADEIETRLRLLRPVRGPLPEALARVAVAWGPARDAYKQTRAAFDEAQAAYSQAWYDRAWDVCDRARVMCGQAQAACDQARDLCIQTGDACTEALETSRTEMEALHREECPGCPWNGETIFPGKEE